MKLVPIQFKLEFFKILVWMILFLSLGTRDFTASSSDCIDCIAGRGAPLPFYVEIFMSEHFNALFLAIDIVFWYLISSAVVLVANTVWDRFRKKSR